MKKKWVGKYIGKQTSGAELVRSGVEGACNSSVASSRQADSGAELAWSGADFCRGR